MSDKHGSPFDSIEGAHQYIGMLREVVEESRKDVCDEISRANPGRGADALYLVSHKLAQLQQHLTATRLILNDLRTLKRRLFDEVPS